MIPLRRGEAAADERLLALAGGGLEDELVRVDVVDAGSTRRRGRRSARATSTIDCSSARYAASEPMIPAATVGPKRSVAVAHAVLLTLLAVARSRLLTSNGVSPGCLDRMRAAIPAMCGVAKLLPVARIVAVLEPRELDLDAAGEELDRRVRVGVELERIGAGVAADRDDGGEAPRVAHDRHVVRRRDDHRVLEVGGVGELAQLGRRSSPCDIERLRLMTS